MIANCKPISHGKAAAEYDLKKEIDGHHVAQELLRRNVFGIDGKEIVKEMQEHQAKSKHRLKNAFFRIEISPAKEENAANWSDSQWQQVIDNNGNLLSDKFSQKRSIDVITKMTAERGHKTADEVSKDLRATIKEKCRNALRTLENYDFEDFCLACKEEGVTVRPNLSASGHRNGYYLSMDGGREFKASQIDRALTDKRIELTWQTEREDYEREREQDNDLEQGWGRIFKR